ncbi:hypothetical protein QTP88_024528 [Uroleucon formosanum]
MTLYVDSSFKYCTKFLHQLFSIHACRNGVFVPVVFCLLPNKNKDTYTVIWEILHEKCHSLNKCLQPRTLVSSSNPVTLSPGNLINVANILQSVDEELKSVALSNSTLHDKLNRLNANTSASIPKSNAQPINLPVVHLKSDTDTRSIQPANQLTASLSSSVKSKFIVVSQKNSSS